jgi:hypothetical protein
MLSCLMLAHNPLLIRLRDPAAVQEAARLACFEEIVDPCQRTAAAP